ncbi:putative pectate lyase [Tricharina praecox]|uniref:putative pectate lyase n=1 Tax=Tricharina praecox TaxID=43433 RepID=UPI0022210469|nr:putative pectate lyase [Tricharina praecox]KAI5847513.1 putative pectate lyase [Tricharina praecox]
MKFTILGWALVGLSQLISAAPSTISKRQSAEAASVGYATLNGGTTGGIGGTVTTVTTLAALTAAVAGDAKKIVLISGTITGAARVDIGSNTSLLGKNSAAALVGIGLRVYKESNVIIRNIKVSKVLAGTGDAIGLQLATNVWVDHVELFSDMDHDKDYYDGLLDITHACDWITVSYCYFHDHWKASLVGHSDSNGDEDTGHLTVTYKHNYWKNINSRTPSFRFGTGHVYNNYFLSVNDGINTRQGAQLLVQNNVFEDTSDPLYSTDDGYAVATGNDFGIGANEALAGTLTTVPYSYSLGSTSTTKAYVIANAGNSLTIG